VDLSLTRERAHDALEQAHKLSVRTPVVEQAATVQNLLGSRLASAALGINNTRTLLRWSQGGCSRREVAEHRLQILYHLVTAISLIYDDRVAVAFLRGSNPSLDNQAPMEVLAAERPARAGPRLLAAVELLLSG